MLQRKCAIINKPFWKLAMMRQQFSEMTVDQESNRVCRCSLHHVSSLFSLYPAIGRSQLDCVRVLISHSMSGGDTWANLFLTGAPSAACGFSVCLILPIHFRSECQNNQMEDTDMKTHEAEFLSQVFPFG